MFHWEEALILMEMQSTMATSKIGIRTLDPDPEKPGP